MFDFVPWSFWGAISGTCMVENFKNKFILKWNGKSTLKAQNKKKWKNWWSRGIIYLKSFQFNFNTNFSVILNFSYNRPHF